jgi:RNA polymerase sigma-70 factor (ECF subfamily)
MVSKTSVKNVEAFLVTVTTRLSLDYLKSARAQRVEYIGPWLPEPLLAETASEPDAETELADTLSFAFMMLLERLNPSERAVYILREAFNLKHAEIAQVLNHSPAYSRQLAKRAKAQLGQHEKRFEASDKDQDRMFSSFLEASMSGDLKPLFERLADDITLYSDGGGKVIAALRPLLGKDRVVRFLRKTLAPKTPKEEIQLCRVNGQPAIKLSFAGHVVTVITLNFVDGKVQQIFVQRNPDKLRAANVEHSTNHP